MVFTQLISGLEFYLTYIVVLVISCAITIVFWPFYLFAGGRYLLLKHLTGHVNRLALPGQPTTAWPRQFPLVGNAKSGWFLGVTWITQWESWFEIGMIVQILPVLLIPLQEIVNNVLEEILSWFEGNANPGLDDDANPNADYAWDALPNFFASLTAPLAFIRFLLFDVPWRCCISMQRACRWVLGATPATNYNHAFVNYAQGLDFSLSPGDIASFFDNNLLREVKLKNYAWVLSKAALLAYERLHVAQRIVDREWNDQNDPNDHLYTSELEAAWCFDVIRSVDKQEIADEEGVPTWAKTTAMLISITYRGDPANPQRALILAFRGTEPLNNANWFTDFATCPPKDYPPAQVLQFGQVHQGFALALGIESSRFWPGAMDPLLPARDVVTSYIVYENQGAGYTARRMPVNDGTWPPVVTAVGAGQCPFTVMSERILGIMRGDPSCDLYVTGHSLGAALAHLYSTALLVPAQSVWNLTPPGQSPLQMDRFRALVTQGQPRLGTFQYNRRLEELLCNSGNPLDYKYMRLVNGDDIVCRVPPLQVTQPPFSPVRSMWQHSGHLVYLPVRHVIEYPGPQPCVMRMFEQPISYRLSVLWNAGRRMFRCTGRYILYGGTGNATLLRVIGAWFIVFVTVPLGIFLLPYPPLLPVALALIVIGLLEAGMLQGVSDHALDGYLNAIQWSQPNQWS